MILQHRKHRTLEREDETGGLMGVLAEEGTAVGQLLEELANLVPAWGSNVLTIALFQAGDDQLQKLRSLLLEVLFLDVARGTVGFQALRPISQQLILVDFHCIECAGLQCCHVPELLEIIGRLREFWIGAKQ